MLNRLPLFFIVMFLVTAGCGQHLNPTTLNMQSHNSEDDEWPVDGSPLPSQFKPHICSKLSFDLVQWPRGVDEFYATVFGLAMNITGSFEGHQGWRNIANNFDGQGISLGLFNQNLGQGSLQPLLIQMRRNHLTRMKSFFTSAQFNSVDSMLSAWNGGPLTSASTKASRQWEDDFSISPLDDPELLEQAGEPVFFLKASSTRNQTAVNWAANNLYSGTKFKPEWQSAFQNLAGAPEYVSYQIEAAKTIHNRAMNYMIKFNFRELRAYLFFFDIVVQNGSLTSSIENQYLNWEKSNKSTSETNKLKQMLEYRLTVVKSQYRNDVRARKLAVINGTGTVHGSSRNFPKEYCAPSWGTVFHQKYTLP